MLRFALHDPLSLVLWVLAILPAIVLHELAHAVVAYRLGDPTPRYEGRLTLDPRAHIDPIGALMLFLFGFGWARPVNVNPYHFANGRRGMMLVALAGPLANVTLAWLSGLLWEAMLWLPGQGMLGGIGPAVREFFVLSLRVNLWLAAFNLLPNPPLDGSRILAGLVSSRQAVALARMEAYGPLLLVLLIMSGVSQLLLQPIYRILQMLVLAGRL
ncbi:MAG: site-2 protease family protein [Firmicutes bacterium]|nr:site-2 protease family protein [Bacillota bacterium]